MNTNRGRWAGVSVFIQVLALLVVGNTHMKVTAQVLVMVLLFTSTLLNFEGWAKLKGLRR